MKNLKTLLLVAIFTLSIGVANAQKVAHIDAEKLLSNMPATKALQVEMEKLQKTYAGDIESMAKKLEKKFKKYEAEAKTQTPEENQKRAQEVQQGRAQIGQAQQAASQDLQKKQVEKLAPILKRVEKAIKDVAAEKGIPYVFDASRGKGLIIFDKGVNLYDAVKTKLGF